jgi:Xaa-Pro aminopeptidase
MDGIRFSKLMAGLQSLHLDGIALMPSSNLRYLTGLSFHPSKRLTLALIPADGRTPSLVLPELEVSAVRGALTVSFELFTWPDAEGPAAALEKALAHTFRQEHIKLAVEYTTMRVMELRALEQASVVIGSALETVDGTTLMATLRMVKDEAEQAAMAQAGRIVDAALGEVKRHIKAGVTERQLMRITSEAIVDAGAQGESFEGIVASGPNSANPHHGGSDRAFQVGDLIVVDCGAVFDGYASDITRTFALGEPGTQARHIYEVVKEANEAGKAAVHAGVTGEQIDRAARGVIERAGFGQYFLHRTGHGLGIEVNPCHEPPDLVAGSTSPFAVGTTFTIEPGVYIEGVGGVRIEDDVVITLDGYRSFTNFERELIVLPA